jgi:hypothetical protein
MHMDAKKQQFNRAQSANLAEPYFVADGAAAPTAGVNGR